MKPVFKNTFIVKEVVLTKTVPFNMMRPGDTFKAVIPAFGNYLSARNTGGVYKCSYIL